MKTHDGLTVIKYLDEFCPEIAAQYRKTLKEHKRASARKYQQKVSEVYKTQAKI